MTAERVTYWQDRTGVQTGVQTGVRCNNRLQYLPLQVSRRPSKGQTMDPAVPLPLAPPLLSRATESAKDWAILHGVAMRTEEEPNSSDVVNFAPFLLLPSPVPRALFDQAKAVQRDFNLLVHRLSQDADFLSSCLKSTIQVDDFTCRLFRIYEQVRREGVAQPVCLGLHRSDYMLDDPCRSGQENGEPVAKQPRLDQLQLKQIEINCIASSFGGLGTQMPGLHRHVLRLCGASRFTADQHLPQNRAMSSVAGGLAAAWELYGEQSAIIVFVVQEENRNAMDQRWLEFAAMDRNPSIRVRRYSLMEIHARGELRPDKTLLVDGLEVAVAYFRAGYIPTDYPTEQEWKARLNIEQSRAIKCPCISYHLAGTKKVQQELAQPGVLEQFLEDPAAVARVRATFAGQYTLELVRKSNGSSSNELHVKRPELLLGPDPKGSAKFSTKDSTLDGKGPQGDRTVQMVMSDSGRFVMKPQREGGGNNIFGDDIPAALNNMADPKERTAYVVMDRVRPAVVSNYMVRPGRDPALTEAVSELGIFGVFIGKGNEVVLNQEGGHLLRTKPSSTEDGGVASGNALLDSPYLI
ncbi:GSS [Branchiostoma lanceolatum]|uniref:Glutathione synthetase n=1 Tax=Branchiostoma lanceolatum TaxID=7740 RepID=A0A8K0A7N9_BRALA|nr:GSS [Branchiostoma lanceolatum]